MKYSRAPRDELAIIAADEAEMFALPTDWQDGRVPVEGYAIDEVYSRDIDDAIMATPSSEGSATLTVSIADTGSFLSAPSAIRTVARRKAWSKYRNNAVADPMLPAQISEDILSLQDGQARPVLALEIAIDPYGTIAPATITRGVIRAKRFTPEHVDAALTEAASGSIDEDSLAMRSLFRVAQRLHHNRVTEGLLQPEDIDTAFPSDVQTHASFIVKEAMVAANRALAGYMADNEIPAMYRVFEHGQRAYYSHQPNPHKALHVPLYLHGTSPLRRFPDFANQANIIAHLNASEYPYPEEKIEIMAGMFNARLHKRTDNRPRPHHNTAPVATKDAALRQRIEAGTASLADLSRALFYQSSDPETTAHIKSQAMQLLASDPLEVRQVVETAIQLGYLKVRTRTVGDMVPTKTPRVIEDSAGGVYAYHPMPRKTHSIGTGYKRAEELEVQRGKQIASDMQLLGSIIGISHEVVLPIEMQEENFEHMRAAKGLLNDIHSAKPCGLQYSYRAISDHVVECTVYMMIGGEVRSASATRRGKELASKVAAYEIATELGLFDPEARIELGLEKPKPKSKKSLAKMFMAIDGHSPQHYLHQYLMKTTDIAPRYSFTRYPAGEEQDSDVVDCTVVFEDKHGRKSIACATSTGKDKAKAIVADHVLRMLGAPIIKRLGEQ